MKKILTMACMVALIGLVAGCCPCRKYQKQTRRPLVGTTWQLIQLNGRNVESTGEDFTVVFHEDKSLSGRGACNRLMGSYEVDESRALKIAPLATTRMACPDMTTEQQFVAALESATHYEMDGPTMMILCNGEMRALLQARD